MCSLRPPSHHSQYCTFLQVSSNAVNHQDLITGRSANKVDCLVHAVFINGTTLVDQE